MYFAPVHGPDDMFNARTQMSMRLKVLCIPQKD